MPHGQISVGDNDIEGALDGASPMSHVDFKKWQCHMSMPLIFHNVTCQI